MTNATAPAARRPRVVVTRRLPEPVEAELRERFDASLNARDEPLDAGALAAAMRDADALLPTVTDRLDAAVLGAEPRRARIIANFGVGYNHIDISAAAARGIAVTNTPDVLTADTADVAIALMLMAARRLGEGERQLRAGEWSGWRPTHMLGTTLAGKTLGIVGFGRIGRAVAQRARLGFGMRVLFHDPGTVDEQAVKMLAAERRGSLDTLLGESDIVSLHCPATPATRHLLDESRLGRMKRSAILVNTARGDVVDERALVRALREGAIR
ncbi:MAG TPA: D-glycerate dehydrogenase, partial [Gemmatimonadaceae bacterium]|nr:D-glycerate dehydrogenase [Gemmatimonadaceae bacterium]